MEKISLTKITSIYARLDTKNNPYTRIVTKDREYNCYGIITFSDNNILFTSTPTLVS